jgi:two-component system sensor histidine kinase DegS
MKQREMSGRTKRGGSRNRILDRAICSKGSGRGMVDIKVLDKIINETVNVIENSKGRIFDIAENARNEYLRLEVQLNQVKDQTSKVIDEVDSKESEFRRARLRLMDVSRDFKRYSEADIKAAYEKAQDVQVDLVVLREREKNLRSQRDTLEISLRNLQDTVKKAEALVSQVGMAMNVLKGTLKELSGQLDGMQQRQLLGLRVINAQEEERRRVARDIHDGPAQTFANLMLRAEICERLLDSDVEAVRRELKGLKTTVRNSLQDIRKVIYDLRPMALDDLGLVPALRRFINDLKEHHGLMVDYAVMGRDYRLPTHIEVGAFRMVQEALNNVIKHASAKSVVVRVEFAEKSLALLIKDDGVGFTVDEALARDGNHFGLLSMRERVDLLEGSWRVDSTPGKGTRLDIRIPLKEEEENGNQDHTRGRS